MWSVWNHPSVTWLQRARATTMYSVTQSHPRVEPARPRLFERYHDRRPTDRPLRRFFFEELMRQIAQSVRDGREGDCLQDCPASAGSGRAADGALGRLAARAAAATLCSLGLGCCPIGKAWPCCWHNESRERHIAARPSTLGRVPLSHFMWSLARPRALATLARRWAGGPPAKRPTEVPSSGRRAVRTCTRMPLLPLPCGRWRPHRGI